MRFFLRGARASAIPVCCNKRNRARPYSWRIFIGTVSQGEPFHASYFHHTVWGLLSLAESSIAMRVSRLWCGPTTLRSLATMGRYPKLIKLVLNLIDQVDTLAPWLAPRRQAWSHQDKQLDALYRAGSICFAMEKAL